jgi:hypothetical protein
MTGSPPQFQQHGVKMIDKIQRIAVKLCMFFIVLYLYFTSILQDKFTIKIKSKFLNNTNTSRTEAPKMERRKYAPNIWKKDTKRKNLWPN